MSDVLPHKYTFDISVDLKLLNAFGMMFFSITSQLLCYVATRNHVVRFVEKLHSTFLKVTKLLQVLNYKDFKLR